MQTADDLFFSIPTLVKQKETRNASRKNRLQPPRTVGAAKLRLVVSATTENKGELNETEPNNNNKR